MTAAPGYLDALARTGRWVVAPPDGDDGAPEETAVPRPRSRFEPDATDDLARTDHAPGWTETDDERDAAASGPGSTAAPAPGAAALVPPPSPPAEARPPGAREVARPTAATRAPVPEVSAPAVPATGPAPVPLAAAPAVPGTSQEQAHEPGLHAGRPGPDQRDGRVNGARPDEPPHESPGAHPVHTTLPSVDRPADPIDPSAPAARPAAEGAAPSSPRPTDDAAMVRASVRDVTGDARTEGAPARPHAGHDVEPAAPTVLVEIGLIEVRLGGPATAPAPVRERSAVPGPSLGDYLRDRTTGGGGLR